MNIKEITVQEYIVHLMDGTKIITCEDIDFPAEKGVLACFEKANSEDLLLIRDFICRHYIPKRAILYISTGDVYEIEETFLRN